jgi:hypothetical protein
VKKAKGLVEEEQTPATEEKEQQETSPEQLLTVQPSQTDIELVPPVAVGHVGRQAIPAKIRKMVFQRGKGKCEYRSPDGRVCGSQHRLEINHKIAVALGGTNELFNLELNCRNHNILHAQYAIGQEWMERFR